MGEYLDQIPEKIQEHIRQITASSGLPDTEESVEQIAEGWLEKKALFERRMAENGMNEVMLLDGDDAHGALIFTYSGSLLTIGPAFDTGRTIEYTSIGLRQDVPDSAVANESAPKGDVLVDSVAEFTNGPVEKSSPVLAIAVVGEDLEPEEEQDLLSEVTQVLTEDFVEVNKTIVQS
ncbi:MAG: hypothetical protein EA428_06165 [Spirochaetaceae bacterium]|nr:MAG: hypothetical protein EA428_06165 [Spirochaetaceae bacterium]